MLGYLTESLNDFSRYVLFVHMICMIILIGSLFCIKFLVKPAIYNIKIPLQRYGKSLKILKNFFILAFICMILILITSYILSQKLNLANPTIEVMINTVLSIWFFGGFNFLFMYFKYKEAKKYFANNEHIEAHESLELIFGYMLPLNFTLGIIGVYFGIVLWGF